MILMERVNTGNNEDCEWRVWEEVLLHTSLAEAQVGEAGRQYPLFNPGARTWSMEAGEPRHVSAYHLTAILAAVGERAKLLHSQHHFPVEPRAVRHARTEQIREQAAAARQSAQEVAVPVPGSLAHNGFAIVIGSAPFAAGAFSAVYAARRRQDPASEDLIYKASLPQPEKIDSLTGLTPFEAEVRAYEQARDLQGIHLPRLLWVQQVPVTEETHLDQPRSHLPLDNPTQHACALPGLTNSTSSAPSPLLGRPDPHTPQRAHRVCGLVLTDVGCTLEQLSLLGTADEAETQRLQTALPTGLLAALSRYVHSHFGSAKAAADTVAGLVDTALAALHERGILHGDVASRNVCLQLRHEQLHVSLIDYNKSQVIDSSSKRAYAAHFSHERTQGRQVALDAMSAAWPQLNSV